MDASLFFLLKAYILVCLAAVRAGTGGDEAGIWAGDLVGLHMTSLHLHMNEDKIKFWFSWLHVLDFEKNNLNVSFFTLLSGGVNTCRFGCIKSFQKGTIGDAPLFLVLRWWFLHSVRVWTSRCQGIASCLILGCLQPSIGKNDKESWKRVAFSSLLTSQNCSDHFIFFKVVSDNVNGDV